MKDQFVTHEIALALKELGFDFKIDKKRVFMQTAYGKGQLIDAVWSGIIEFIKWYNNNALKRT